MIRYRKAAGALLLSAALLLSPAGCRADDAAESEPTASASPEDAVSRPISVTFSEALLHETGLDPAATARGLGLTNVTDNDDGSCTIQMTAEEQETASAALRESLDEQLLALPESGTWPFLDAVELSNDCTKATLHSAAARYSPARDNTVAQAVYIPALLCAAFSGEDPEAFAIHFTVLDSDGKTVLGEFDYPEPEAAASPGAEDPAAGESQPPESAEA